MQNYKAISQLYTDGKVYEAGAVYTAKEVKGLDLTNFIATDEAAKGEVKVVAEPKVTPKTDAKAEDEGADEGQGDEK